MTAKRFDEVIAELDRLNGEDPNRHREDGEARPSALVYSLRMSECLAGFAPDASELLRIAVRAQHLQRWKIRRDGYPAGRAGYKRWRLDLANMHAELTGDVLRRHGFAAQEVQRVQSMLRKERLKRDPEVQTLEDVACLVFLRWYFADFALAHSREKLIGILRKSWNKMSVDGQAAALQLQMPDTLAELVHEALHGTQQDDSG